MFRNYLKVSIRNILRYKVFSFINIFGLAVAMSICLLIILMLADQMQYDEFHAKKDRIYRVVSKSKDPIPYATSPEPLAGLLSAEYPIVEKSVRLIMGVGGDATYNEQTQTMRGFFSDPTFFDVFGFELEHGDPESALKTPNTIVITYEFAKRLFGDEDPIGKIIKFDDRGLPHLDISGVDTPPVDWGNFTITGVIANNNYKSHLKFDVLMSSATMQSLQKEEKIKDRSGDWEYYYQCYTYVLLEKDQQVSSLATSLSSLAITKYTDIEDLHGFQLIPQPVTDIATGRLMSNMSFFSLPAEGYYLLGFLALVIMISACLNYTNLSIARVLTRAKEIGVRKVTGATRKDLIFQFLSESVLVSLMALLLAIALLIFIKPAFMGLWINKYLNFDLQENLNVYLAFTAFALIIGIIAGVFPAIHMSKYMPVTVLKGMSSIKAGKLSARKILTGLQFGVSLFFIVTSILIYNQLRYFLDFEYGFTSESIVNIELQSNDYKLVSNEFSTVAGVEAVSACAYLPATGINYGISLKREEEDEYENFTRLSVDEYFIENLDLKLVAGRNLPPSAESGERYIVVNEETALFFGYENPTDIIGLILDVKNSESSVEVIGVVKDFRFKLLMFDDDIKPLVLRNEPNEFSYLNIKIASGDVMETVAKLENKWKSIDSIHPFKYQFFDQQLANTHQVFVDLVAIIGTIAFLAITIACLGLLGMATFTAERRMKEVSIRKVLGAENMRIAFLLSKSFLKLLTVSVLISAPLTYLINNLWLENFGNRVDFGIGTILLGTFILLVLGLLTIGSQTIRVARANPVDNLKAE